MKLKSSWSQAEMFSLSVNKTEVKIKKPQFVFVLKIEIFFSVDSKNRICVCVITSFLKEHFRFKDLTAKDPPFPLKKSYFAVVVFNPALRKVMPLTPCGRLFR